MGDRQAIGSRWRRGSSMTEIVKATTRAVLSLVLSRGLIRCHLLQKDVEVCLTGGSYQVTET